jgi:hypothetical protein
MTEYTTYEQGMEDAKNDLAEGWICLEDIAKTTPEKLAQELVVNVGAKPDYIRGFLDGITL